ncbi:PDDEXK nuclease domain-containing protein [uncultured Prevotella sp.]|uniref:PDDEXK nuclease domain-containing protein n=1 Tax=uncultured Prevotella sp. TaxID=159272 RepID=UPI00263A33A6|nr:PDDEXK nuclease domain-containing protein [uncultured Prevotella sp.]
MDKISTQYNQAVQLIKTAILTNQLEAAKAVNRQMLALYYGVGKYVSDNTRNGCWGTGAIETISEQLRRELPGLRGFSPTSIKKMRIFYEQWCDFINRPPMADDLQSAENQESLPYNALLSVNRPPLAGDLDWYDFFSLSFSHHDEILSKTKTLEERAFYIHQAATLHWDKYTLRDNLKADLYHHQSQMPSNFAKTMPTTRHALKAISMFKDDYLLDFINIEEIDEWDSQDIDERVIENSIVNNVKNFILTFGKDFTFMGNQVHIDKFGHDHWVDLLFFNRELQSLVVFELKKGAFKPAYLGQLSAYIRMLNDDERKPHENPTIGIVLCRDADKTYVEYLLQDYTQPMGVATYKVMPEKLKRILPPEEDFKKILDGEEPL